MKKLILSLFAVLVSVVVMADDVKMTKSYGDISLRGYGSSGTTTISAATQFYADELQPYKGGSITKVRAYINANNLKTFKIWVKKNVDDKTELASKTVASPVPGWNEVEFDTPIKLEDDMPIALGYTYTQNSSSPCYGLTFSKYSSKGGLYLSMGSGAYEDYSATFGNLTIEATVTDITVDHPAVKVLDIALASSFYGTNQVGKATVNYTCIGTRCSSITMRLTCDGKSTDAKVRKTLRWGDLGTGTFEFETPEDVNFDAEVTATVVAIDGEPYEGNSVSASFKALAQIYPRTVVIEEGTGTWCGWCVRGIVAMDQMKEKYPDTFIGIAVHGGNDKMALSDYVNNLGLPGFPSCTVDRRPSLMGVDVSPTAFENYYKAERELQSYADFKFDAYIEDESKVVAESKAVFDFNKEDADIRMTYVLIEDGITGYAQSNYYAGGGYGTMGGFENLSSSVANQVYNDVARAIYPSFAGLEGSLASSIVRGEEYTNKTSFDIPAKVKNKEKLSLVALMLDGTTGEVINAHKMQLSKREAIDGIHSPGSNTNSRWYGIDGTVLSEAPTTPGLYINNGRKVVIK